MLVLPPTMMTREIQLRSLVRAARINHGQQVSSELIATHDRSDRRCLLLVALSPAPAGPRPAATYQAPVCGRVAAKRSLVSMMVVVVVSISQRASEYKAQALIAPHAGPVGAAVWILEASANWPQLRLSRERHTRQPVEQAN